MTFSNDSDDILYSLTNTHPDNHSDIELLRRAREEIKRLREANERLGRRYEEMCDRVGQLMKEQFHE